MTPPPATAAGRGTTTKRSNVSGAPPAGGHRRKLWRAAAPKAPRRVSGPQRARVAGTTAAPARPRQAPSASWPRPARRAAPRPAGPRQLPARALRFVRGLPELALVDRLVRGRVWIPLLGLLLAGIVAMQVELLKLNSAIGHGIDRSATLQSQNEQLRASVATLADDQRIERIAATMGMVMPSPDNVAFVTPQGSADLQQALARMRAPDATALAIVQQAQASNPPASSSSASSTTPATGSGAPVPLVTASSQSPPASTATGN